MTLNIKTKLKNAQVASKPPDLIKAIYIAIKTIAIINEPANLVIRVAVLSTPLP